MRRNTALNKQLRDKQLRVVDVAGDGNCFFRALSIGMVGHQNNHMAIRQSVAIHVASQFDCGTADDLLARRQRTADIMIGGTWVEEDIILAGADCLKRDIQVFKHIEANGTSPKIYTPLSGPAAYSPLIVAFIEPGYYRAVQNSENIAKISRLQAKSSVSSNNHLNSQGRC